MLVQRAAAWPLLLLLAPLLLLPPPLLGAVPAEVKQLNAQCRQLLSCAVKKHCVHMVSLARAFEGHNVSALMYDALDKAIDYGCVFTAGCLEECARCPLCQGSKQQLVDVLSGSRREQDGECAVLVNCAADCVEASGTDVGQINFCLRRKCAFHCFDGSCPKCSGFVTRIFNQVCVSGDLRARVLNFEVSIYFCRQ